MKAITVVTVCYNEEKNIARTIESVLMQATTEFEYIICDGLSKDNTVSIAQSYQDAFAQKGVSYRIYSEKDGGIYDAMNKGIDRASGEYIWFLNAGDWFCDANVLRQYIDAIKKDCTPAVYYSDFYFVSRHQRYLYKCNADLLTTNMSLGHPAMVAKVSLMRQRKFDTSYRIAADYHFVLGLKLDNLEFRHLDLASTYFLDGGISTQNKQLDEEERTRLFKHYGLPYKPYVAPKESLQLKIIKKMIKMAPEWLWKFWRVNIKHRPWIEY